MTTHTTRKWHKEFAASSSSASTRFVASYFRPEVSKNVTLLSNLPMYFQGDAFSLIIMEYVHS